MTGSGDECRSLAEKACAIFALAGFPAHLAEPLEDLPGFEIEVDGQGEGARVFVNWRTSEKLLNAAMEAYQQGRQADPARLLYEAVQLRMRELAVQVLTSAGFQAADAGGYRSPDIEVKSSGDVFDSLIEP